jgi:release factor H-coupled RctB family protein
LAAVPNCEYVSDCPIPDFGSIGSGNHFAEFQAIHEVFDGEGLARLNMDRNELFITVHSGSRSYGSKILQEFNGYDGYAADGKDAKGYLAKHDDALIWASRNRLEAAKKLIDYLGFSQAVELKLECGHNFLEEAGGLYYHRKGVVSTKRGAAFIAGSRGTLSYIVMPTEKCAEYGFSLAHGSGRKWARSMCKPRIREKYTLETIKRNKFGGQLVCHDYDLLFEEAPDAYKNVETIIAVLEKYGMIERIAAVKPLLTFKG